jgi:pantothenate kinase
MVAIYTYEFYIIITINQEKRNREMREYNVNINGIDVNAKYSETTINAVFLPLLQRLTDMQKKKDGRILVMLAAPPGAGKSTLSSFLEVLSKEQDDLCNVQAIGMDGFHRRQEYLLSHDTERDGKTIKMVEIKGAPITFDLEKLTEAVKRVASGKTCGWPSYDRHLHNPVEDTYTVSEKIVILEGNYLLLNEDGWRELRNYADYTIRIIANEDFLRSRLIDRKAKSGNTLEKATAFVDFSDMANVRICLNDSLDAHMTLSLDENDDYKVV